MPTNLELSFDHWESIELFCRIISKFENIDLNEFSDMALIHSRLENYKHETNYNKITEVIFGLECTDPSGKKNYNRPRLFYDFVTALRNKDGFAWAKQPFQEVAIYIEMPETKFKTSRPIEKFDPNPKMSALANTHWWLYFYNESKPSSFELVVEKIVGISVAVIQFNKFARFELKIQHPGIKGFASYHGIYTVINKKYLELSYQATDIRDNELHMRFYLGDGAANYVFGNMDSFDNPANAHNVTLEKIYNLKRRNPKPFFYRVGIKKSDSGNVIYVDVEDQNNVPLKSEIVKYFLANPKEHPTKPISIGNEVIFSEKGSDDSFSVQRRKASWGMLFMQSRVKALIEFHTQKLLKN